MITFDWAVLVSLLNNLTFKCQRISLAFLTRYGRVMPSTYHEVIRLCIHDKKLSFMTSQVCYFNWKLWKSWSLSTPGLSPLHLVDLVWAPGLWPKEVHPVSSRISLFSLAWFNQYSNCSTWNKGFSGGFPSFSIQIYGFPVRFPSSSSFTNSSTSARDSTPRAASAEVLAPAASVVLVAFVGFQGIQGLRQVGLWPENHIVTDIYLEHQFFQNFGTFS